MKSDLDDAFEELNEYESKYSTKDLAHALKKLVESIPSAKMKVFIQNKGFEKEYRVLFDLFKQQFQSSGNKIISVVDPEARLAHKS